MEMNQALTLDRPMNLSRSYRINLRLVNKALMALLAISFVYYLTSTNDLAVKSFQLKELKNNIANLQQSNTDLEVQSASLASFQVLKEKISTLDLVRTNEVQYIKVATPVVAKK